MWVPSEMEKALGEIFPGTHNSKNLIVKAEVDKDPKWRERRQV